MSKTAVLLNALASTAGGGITYLRNVLPRLQRHTARHRYVVLTPPEHLSDYAPFAGAEVQIETISLQGGLLKRLWWEQTALRHFIQARKIQALVSLGNFALFASPVPQLLFNRNDLYFSADFVRDLRQRKQYGLLAAHQAKSWLARRSIRQATLNVTPTTAFAERIRTQQGLEDIQIEALPFGFDAARFSARPEPLPETQWAKLDLRSQCRRVLYVSHYNYFRNFETLLRALPHLRNLLREQRGEDIQLVLTTDIRRGAIYGGYDATTAAELIERLGVQDCLALLGGVPYEQLHHLYRVCDLFVCPSYSESFGHPLVEAMAAGLPVVSADLPVHREVCADAAVYFDVFDERVLAQQAMRVLTDSTLQQTLRTRGLARSRQFSWDAHVEQLESLISRLLQNHHAQ